MRIDWSQGWWQVWNLDGVLLGKFRRVVLAAPAELVNTDGNRHGWLVTAGKLEPRGDVALIRQETTDGQGSL